MHMSRLRSQVANLRVMAHSAGITFSETEDQASWLSFLNDAHNLQPPYGEILMQEWSDDHKRML
jgi:hypothetical protein